MAADDDDDQEPRRRRRGTARLQLASRLPWLGCYPVAARGGVIDLCDPHRDAHHRLDRAGLAAATRSVRQVVRDHREALAGLVGDVDRWQRLVMAIVDGFKPAIHDGAPLPSAWSIHPPAIARRAVRLSADAPALAPVLEAIGWIHALDRTPPVAALGWLEQRRGSLARLVELLPAAVPAGKRREATPSPVARVLAVRRLAEEEGDRLVDPLLDALADPACHAATICPAPYLRALHTQLVQQSDTPAARPPPAPLGPPLLALFDRLPTMPADRRRASLRAMAAARLPALAAGWAQRWERADAIARSLARQQRTRWKELGALERELIALLTELPGAVDVGELARVLAAPSFALVALVEAAPTFDVRVTAAQLLLALHAIPRTPAAEVTLGAALAACVADDPAGRWLLVWRRMLEGRLAWFPDDDAADGWAELAGLALREVLDDAGHDTLDELARIAADRRDVAATVACWRAWSARGPRPREALELGLALSSTAGELTAVATALGKLDDDELARDLAGLRSLWPTLDAGAAGILRRLTIGGEHARVSGAARLVGLLAHRGAAVPPLIAPPPAPLPPELARYPAALHPALAHLAAAGAGSLAAGVLDTTFPDPRDLARELATIEARLAAGSGDARLRKRADNLRARLAAPPAPTAERIARLADKLERADNLRARLAAPPAPTAERIARLADKLERAADVAVFERWRIALRDLLAARARAALDLDVAPAWLDAPDYQRVLLAVPGLPDRVRGLARRLLARRAGPPPWDLRDDGANAAWLGRLRRRGLDPGPWIDGIGPVVRGQVTLALEDDPLEVLRMGEHFSTCLSPGASNFFSAVVNAAEINKRVIYGRDPDGRVMGRCLVALTDGGGLVTFHPFNHGRPLFLRWLADFVGELARRMGTIAVPRGPIRELFGCGWYDDGPHDLTGAFGFLADGAPFRKGLATIALDRLVDELADRFARPVDGLVLTLVIPLAELAARPELIVPLLPLVEAADDIDDEIRVAAAGLAIRAGRADRLGDRFVAQLRTAWSWCQDDLDLLELLAARSPGRLLALLRRHASRSPPHHDYGLGLALAALNRPTQAADALRAAIRGGERDVARRARARLAR